jgi:hypothetical protein
MAESAPPHPSKTRLGFADEVAARRIRWYNHEPPVAHHTITGRKHTSDLDELVRAELAFVPPCPPGHSSIAELTPDGMAWVTRARTREPLRLGDAFPELRAGPGSTSPEPGPPTACPDYPDCSEERFVRDLAASVRAGEAVGKFVTGCAACGTLVLTEDGTE